MATLKGSHNTDNDVADADHEEDRAGLVKNLFRKKADSNKLSTLLGKNADLSKVKSVLDKNPSFAKTLGKNVDVSKLKALEKSPSFAKLKTELAKKSIKLTERNVINALAKKAKVVGLYAVGTFMTGVGLLLLLFTDRNYPYY